ncbi:MAG: hypothetical protein WCF67_24175 [Chitinophagaceae bacterium]
MHILRLLLAVIAICICAGVDAQSLTFPGKNAASDKPSLFAEGIVSDGMNNRDFTISPQGDEIFYSIQQKDFGVSTIIRLHKKNNNWSSPEVASFSGKYKDLEAVFSPDGKRIYFASNRPVDANDSIDDFDIWFVNRTASGWSEPVHAGFVVNGPGNEFYPSVAKNGNLYFTGELKESKGREDIFVCTWQNGNYSSPVSLPEAINSKNFEYNAFVDPDEQFILFTSSGRADDMGRGDLYISKKDASGTWQAAQHLPEGINTKFHDYCPYVSPDKKLFFFSSNRSFNKAPFDQKKNYETISSMLRGAGNGLDDIYWMNAGRLLGH